MVHLDLVGKRQIELNRSQLREHPIFFRLVLAFSFSGVRLIIRFETSSVFFFFLIFLREACVLSGITS